MLLNNALNIHGNYYTIPNAVLALGLSPGAIAVYNRILKTIGDRDPVTSRIILEILEDEEEHEFEFRQIREDIDASREALGMGNHTPA